MLYAYINVLFFNFTQKFFNPINNRSGPNPIISNGTNIPIELQVTNLDQNIDIKDMKRILSSVFMEHVSVSGYKKKVAIYI